MSADLEKRIQEWGIWYHEHMPYVLKAQDPVQAMKFQMKAIDGCLELLAIATADIRRLERKRPELILPTGVQLHGDPNDLRA